MLRHGHSQLGAAAVGLGAVCTANPGVPHIPQGTPTASELGKKWGQAGEGWAPPEPTSPTLQGILYQPHRDRAQGAKQTPKGGRTRTRHCEG